MCSPPLAEPIRTLNLRLRATVLGSQMFEIRALVAAREFEEDLYGQAMKRAHGARVPAKDALMIRFGMALFREHKVSPELYADVVKTFGQRGTIEATWIMGDYAMAAVALRSK